MVYQLIAMVVGAFFILRFLFCTIKMALSYLPLLTGPKVDVKKLGKWAVVTGATDGIGKAYAFELAGRGMNVVLISRTLEKLKAVAQELEAAHPVQTKVIQADFTKPDIYEGIAVGLEGLDVGVLVNNVGIGYDHPDYLENLDNPEVFCPGLLNANMLSVTRMSTLLLPRMKANRRGLIVNISSLSGATPTPLLTLYAASKSFVVAFSRALEIECEQAGVLVQCIMPGFVVTNLSKLRRATLAHPSPATFVRCAMATVGVTSVSAGYPVHDVMMNALLLLDQLVASKPMARYTMGFLTKVRAAALRKKNKAQ